MSSTQCALRKIDLEYSLADLVRITGAKYRSVQLWADAGAIRAYAGTDRRGTGTHRRFSRDEVIIASIINALSQRQVAIGELVRISRGVRGFLNSGKFRADIETAILGKQPTNPYLLVIWSKDGDPDVFLGNANDLSLELDAEMEGDFHLSLVLPLKQCLAGLGS